MYGTTAIFEAQDYPVTTEQLVDRFGDRTLDLPNGTETLGEALTRSGVETFETAEDAQYALMNGLSRKAIGRQGYSDRDPMPPGCPHGPDQVSF